MVLKISLYLKDVHYYQLVTAINII